MNDIEDTHFQSSIPTVDGMPIPTLAGSWLALGASRRSRRGIQVCEHGSVYLLQRCHRIGMLSSMTALPTSKSNRSVMLGFARGIATRVNTALPVTHAGAAK